MSQFVNGLTNGKAYTFTVAAVNLAGTGVDSAPSAVVRVGGPTAPNVVAIGSSRQVVLTWTTPANNGAKITSYAITVFTGGVAQAGLAHTVTCSQPCTPATNWTVTGLTNGTLYTFKVAAINSRGSGPVGSTAVKASATAIKPGAPTAVVATAGAATANIAWVAPSNGTATITAYVVHSVRERRGPVSARADLPGTGLAREGHRAHVGRDLHVQDCGDQRSRDRRRVGALQSRDDQLIVARRRLQGRSRPALLSARSSTGVGDLSRRAGAACEHAVDLGRVGGELCVTLLHRPEVLHDRFGDRDLERAVTGRSANSCSRRRRCDRSPRHRSRCRFDTPGLVSTS